AESAVHTVEFDTGIPSRTGPLTWAQRHMYQLMAELGPQSQSVNLSFVFRLRTDVTVAEVLDALPRPVRSRQQRPTGLPPPPAARRVRAARRRGRPAVGPTGRGRRRAESGGRRAGGRDDVAATLRPCRRVAGTVRHGQRRGPATAAGLRRLPPDARPERWRDR